MTGLRDTAERLRRLDPYPLPSLERLFATQRASANLEGRRLGAGHRTEPTQALRRQLGTMMGGGQDVAPLVARALAEERRSIDRALIHAYLAAMPCAHPQLPDFRDAARVAAERHDWHWRELGRRHSWWEPARDDRGIWALPTEAAGRGPS